MAKKLYSDLHKGLDPHGQGLASIEAHASAYGANRFKEVPPKSVRQGKRLCRQPLATSA